MIELEEALRRILSALPAPQMERLPLMAASGRVLAGGIRSQIDLPRFDNSTVDGYALRSVDVAGASSGTPVRLRLRARVPAGEVFTGEIISGECVRLFTGSPVPAGADAVVMQEDTRAGADNGEVSVCESVKPGENIRLRGEDVASGESLAIPGDVLTPGKTSLLAATGNDNVTVGRRPIVALMATGSELREGGESLADGTIYESNRAALALLISAVAARPEVLPIVSDDPQATKAALERAFGLADIVVTCGGVSVGEMDFVKPAFEEIGGRLEFWKVAMRPGKPFVFGRLGDAKFLFGLPGNPVSAFVTFLLLVRPALLRWQGAHTVTLPWYPGILGEPLVNRGDRRHFARVRMDESGKIFSAGKQASHIQHSLALADGLVDVPAKTELPAGSTIRVLRWT